LRASLGDEWSAASYPLLSQSLAPEWERWRASILLASMRIERHALDIATVARIRAERAAILPGWKGPSTDEMVAARQRRFEEQGNARVKVEGELAEMLALDELLRSVPRRPLTDDERAVIESEREARERFTAVALAVARLDESALD